VNPDQDQHRRNRLLAALRPPDFALLEPHLQIVPIGEGECLHLPGDEIEQVYFLHKGIVSLMAISEVGMQSPRRAWEARELSVRL
jgi:CRP-like cAMP-binding protein